MKLNEFFTYGADGFEQDKTYEPENDISILDSEDTRKTRLTLKQINSMRLASEAHDAQQKEEAVRQFEWHSVRHLCESDHHKAKTQEHSAH